jgi:peptide/nickel transport system permease protein
MIRFIARRLAFMILVLFGMTLITFTLTHVVPSDPVRLLAGPHATQTEIETLRHTYGMDHALPAQYVIYLQNLIHGNLGISLTDRHPVVDDIKQFFPATLELALCALIIAVGVGVPLGVYAATGRGRLVDALIRLTSIAGVSMPIFWLGLVVQFVFFKQLGWLPIGGRLDLVDSPPNTVTGLYLVDAVITGNFAVLGDVASHLVLPAITLALGSLVLITRMTRASVLEILAQDYIRTARAKGVAYYRIVFRHALKNAITPTLTVIGLQLGYLLSGDFLAETIFNWPGIGYFGVNAISNLDFPGIMGVTLVVSVIYVVANLIVDILYVVVDPRVEYS